MFVYFIGYRRENAFFFKNSLRADPVACDIERIFPLANSISAIDEFIDMTINLIPCLYLVCNNGTIQH